MEPALAPKEPTPFPEPSRWPEWKPFTRGQYALSYDPYATETTETEETDGTETDGTTANPVGPASERQIP
jgi:hypothetical protein